MTNIYLGKLVKTSFHREATTFMIKRIDTEQEAAFLVPVAGGHGGWYSFGVLLSAA